MSESIKGFVTDDGSVAQYDYNSLHGLPEVFKSIPTGQVGHYICVDKVDSSGKVISVTTVAPSSSGGLAITDDGAGNVTITSGGTSNLVDDGVGNISFS